MTQAKNVTTTDTAGIETMSTTSTTYSYNNANQMINSTDIAGTTTYTYDANGNQTKKTKGNDEWNWTYNYDNMQIEYDDPVNTNDTTYTYDAYGRRISRTNTQTLTSEHYLYDGSNVIADYDGSNNLTASYITPFLDQNLLVTRYSPPATTYYYMQDGLGSIRSMLNAQSSVVNSYDYYAFGETYGTPVQGVTNRYMYTGREWDAESQTIHHRYRNNDPRLGRFLSADPIEYGGGINLYSYVENNSINKTDPFGLFAKEAMDIPPTQPVQATEEWPSNHPPQRYAKQRICPDWCSTFNYTPSFISGFAPNWPMDENEHDWCVCPSLAGQMKKWNPATDSTGSMSEGLKRKIEATATKPAPKPTTQPSEPTYSHEVIKSIETCRSFLTGKSNEVLSCLECAELIKTVPFADLAAGSCAAACNTKNFAVARDLAKRFLKGPYYKNEDAIK